MNATLGEKIKELRQGVNLSLRQLADKVKKSPPFISDIELGRRYPSDDVLQDIAKSIGTSFDDPKELDTRGSGSPSEENGGEQSGVGTCVSHGRGSGTRRPYYSPGTFEQNQSGNRRPKE